MKTTNFAQIGFGPIGQRIAEYSLKKESVKLVSVVDIDKNKAGKDIGEFLNREKMGIKITDDIDSVLKNDDIEIVSISTTSNFKELFQTIKKCIKNRKNVISTCEELLFPWVENKELAHELDKLAKDNNVTVLGTGINPGFLMDFLPIVLSTLQKSCEGIIVRRFQNASKRRLPFQKKIGAGLDIETFDRLVKEGKIRHVGFKESVYLIATALGLKIDEYKEEVKPVVAEEEIKSEYISVKRGSVKGVYQTAIGLLGKKEIIKLELMAFLGNPQEEDTVELIGIPHIKSTIPGGVNGDIGTAAVVVNTIKSVVNSYPGLKTVVDIPPAHFWR